MIHMLKIFKKDFNISGLRLCLGIGAVVFVSGVLFKLFELF